VASSKTLLIKFAWRGGDPIGLLTSALTAVGGDAGDLRVFRALDAARGYAGEADEGYTYVRPLRAVVIDDHTVTRLREALREVLPDATLVVLDLLMELAGASAGKPAPYHYVVETDVLPEFDVDLNAWYDQEHLPGLARVPGTVRAARFVNVDGSPRYHACYDLVSTETLGSARWLAVRGTSWSSRVRPAFRNTKRTMFRRVGGR
jgi:hypothetical protein